MTPVRKHAKLSASGAKRWMSCPPSMRLEQHFPETQSEAADEGTLAHHLSDLLLELHLGWIGKKKARDEIAKVKDHPLYQPEMMDLMKDWRDYILDEYADMREEDKTTKLYIESRIDYGNYAKNGFGTTDRSIANNYRLKVLDLKYGKGVPVFAEGNPQIRIYGLGMHNLLRDEFDYDQVELTIYQPRLHSITTEKMSLYDLTKWGHKVLKPAAEIAWHGQGEFNPGEHCKFCRAKAGCQALADYNLELLLHDFALGGKLDEDLIPEILEKGAQLVDWFNAVKEYARDRAMDGKIFKGWKLVHGRSDRKYVDEEQVYKRLKRAGYGSAEITKSKLIGIGEMEKLLKGDFMKVLDGLIIKPKGAATLVPESDKRERYNSVISDFKDLIPND